MDNVVLLYTLSFVAYSLLEITGTLPQEIISAGLSLPSLFKKYYGDEGADFVFYHTKRTTATILIHCCLPLCYIIGLQAVYPHFNIVFFWQAEATIIRLTIIALLVLSFGIITTIIFVKSEWKYHPFIKILSKYYGQDWKLLASIINSEYRSIDKFISTNGHRRLIITDNWIIYCGIHTINVVKQSDITLHVEQADNHRVNNEAETQYLTIKITSNGIHQTSFNVRLCSDEYTQMRLLLSSPVNIARQIVIQQSVDDRFLQVFTEQITINGIYTIPNGSEPLELCFGCSQKLPEVKLTKLCSPLQEGECRSCDCKPMWCISCMSKWYISKQDKNHPDTWMGSNATCPLCRKTFCLLDILRIEQ